MKELIKNIVFYSVMSILLLSILVWTKTQSSRPISVVKVTVTNALGELRQGTGFFIADDLVMTAGHMVKDANNISVLFPDGKQYSGYGWYQEEKCFTDVGLFRVKTSQRERRVSFITCKVGDKVKAIGNPQGYFPVITWGRISAVKIDEKYFGTKNLIMADVALNPGNSGCPLIGTKGIVGMYVGGVHSLDNVTFCIPAKILQLVLDKYKATEALREAS